MWENIPHDPTSVKRRPVQTNVKTRPGLVRAAALRLLRPLVRLLLREGVAYGSFVAELKPVFVEAARAELASRGMAVTDSAVTLLSGVHRRDVRLLARRDGSETPAPPSLAAQVAGRWLSEPPWLDEHGQPRVLPRSGAGSFYELVQGISSDIRPRAMLDEMLRLGVVRDDGAAGIAMHAANFSPRAGFEEMTALMADNVHDHLAAAGANLAGGADHLEQAMFSDGLSAESVKELDRAAAAAWQQVVRQVLPLARQRFEADAGLPAAERCHRMRFGAYFYSEREDSQ
jgi:Family of unknown function (DUF6502)